MSSFAFNPALLLIAPLIKLRRVALSGFVRLLLLTLFGGPLIPAFAQSSEQAFTTLNRYRQALGLSRLVRSETLTQPAQTHSAYLNAITDRNIFAQVSSDGVPEIHLEHPHLPHFTGQTVGDRVKYVNYPYSAGEQVNFSDSHAGTGAFVVEQLIATVYHRSGLLNPIWTEMGVAVDRPLSVLVFGEGASKGQVRADWIGVFPPHQSTTARIGFNNEVPDPAPDRPGQWLGLPISIHTDSAQALTAVRFDVIDTSLAPTAPKLLGRTLTTATDKAVAPSEAFFLPEKPLRYNSRYEVSATFTTEKKTQTLRWWFQTPPDPYTVSPQASASEVIPGVPVRLEIKGVEGNLRWQLKSRAPSGTEIEIKEIEPKSLQISFPITCDKNCLVTAEIKHEGPHPSVTQRTFVVSQAWLAVKGLKPR